MTAPAMSPVVRLLVVCLALSPVACLKFGKSPQVVVKPDSEIAKLIDQAKSSDTKTRHLAIAKLLTELRAGMDRETVERWLGTPRSVSAWTAGGEGAVYTVYYCQPLGYDGRQLMTVHYQKTDRGYTFEKVEGPHFPES